MRVTRKTHVRSTIVLIAAAWPCFLPGRRAGRQASDLRKDQTHGSNEGDHCSHELNAKSTRGEPRHSQALQDRTRYRIGF